MSADGSELETAAFPNEVILAEHFALGFFHSEVFSAAQRCRISQFEIVRRRVAVIYEEQCAQSQYHTHLFLHSRLTRALYYSSIMERPSPAHLERDSQYELQDNANSKGGDDTVTGDARSPETTSTSSQDPTASPGKETWRDPAANIFRMAAVLLVR